MKIYCCGCSEDVKARLTNGEEIYPHRPDLKTIPFWICDTCKNYVGCHHKTKNRTHPLGYIATPELREAKKHIHGILDPLWQSGTINRGSLYKMITEKIGWKYHTAKIKDIDEARRVFQAIKDIANVELKI